MFVLHIQLLHSFSESTKLGDVQGGRQALLDKMGKFKMALRIGMGADWTDESCMSNLFI